MEFYAVYKCAHFNKTEWDYEKTELSSKLTLTLAGTSTLRISMFTWNQNTSPNFAGSTRAASIMLSN